jgi:hypothetical protein
MTNGEYRQDFIERLTSEFSPERVLYASCAPVFDPVFEHKRIRSARMTDKARSAVEGGNATRCSTSDGQRVCCIRSSHGRTANLPTMSTRRPALHSVMERPTPVRQ